MRYFAEQIRSPGGELFKCQLGEKQADQDGFPGHPISLPGR